MNPIQPITGVHKDKPCVVGKVVQTHGCQFTVQLTHDMKVQAIRAGSLKKNMIQVVIGDFVTLYIPGSGEIFQAFYRGNLFDKKTTGSPPPHH